MSVRAGMCEGGGFQCGDDGGSRSNRAGAPKVAKHSVAAFAGEAGRRLAVLNVFSWLRRTRAVALSRVPGTQKDAAAPLRAPGLDSPRRMRFPGRDSNPQCPRGRTAFKAADFASLSTRAGDVIVRGLKDRGAVPRTR